VARVPTASRSRRCSLINPIRGPGDRDASTVGAALAVAEAHQLAGDAETLRNAHQQVVGQHPAALDDLGDLGLGLPGQLRNPTLGDPGVPEDPVQRGDVAVGEDPAHVLTPVQRGVDRRSVPRCRSTGYMPSDLVGVTRSPR